MKEPIFLITGNESKVDPFVLSVWKEVLPQIIDINKPFETINNIRSFADCFVKENPNMIYFYEVAQSYLKEREAENEETVYHLLLFCQKEISIYCRHVMTTEIQDHCPIRLNPKIDPISFSKILHTELIKEGWINCTIREFDKLFIVDNDNIFKKIKFLGGQPELTALIKSLCAIHSGHILLYEKSYQDVIIENFVDGDGKPYSKNVLASTFSRYSKSTNKSGTLDDKFAENSLSVTINSITNKLLALIKS